MIRTNQVLIDKLIQTYNNRQVEQGNPTIHKTLTIDSLFVRIGVAEDISNLDILEVELRTNRNVSVDQTLERVCLLFLVQLLEELIQKKTNPCVQEQ